MRKLMLVFKLSKTNVVELSKSYITFRAFLILPVDEAPAMPPVP